jgi:putative glutamine amidotransferase
MIDIHPCHTAGEKYIAALHDAAGALPLLVPVLDRLLDYGGLFDAVDALMFTGAPTNIHPRRYEGSGPREGVALDQRRDSVTLPLISAAIEAEVPILCICRGHQELNVALGGTLHQHLHESPGRMDHREDKSAPIDVRYGPAHDIQISKDGRLDRLYGDAHAVVNSVHAQGVDRLAPRLIAEAVAPDRTVEAMSLKGPGYVLGVQWHPEWRAMENPLSRAIFANFGQEARKRADTLAE